MIQDVFLDRSTCVDCRVAVKTSASTITTGHMQQRPVPRIDAHLCRYAESPLRFEAGTPAIAESIGLGAACDYLSGIGMARVQDAEHQLGGYLYEQVGATMLICGLMMSPAIGPWVHTRCAG